MKDLYIMGYSAAYLQILSSRNAAEPCRYLMPHVKPGASVLDVGCGPSSLSVGLAEAIGNGELHGIDIEPSQVEMSEQAARERGLTNATFSVADVKSMPFEAGTFDLIHCHDLLAFTPNPEAALNEVKRVLKSGGILGCRGAGCIRLRRSACRQALAPAIRVGSSSARDAILHSLSPGRGLG